MIGRLRGLLVFRSEERVMVEVGGVGYEVLVTPRDQTFLPGIAEEVVLHTHMALRDDRIVLFGFCDENFRDLFRVLIECSGVGPTLAMGILSALSPEDIRRAAATDDVNALTAAPGVGKRKAEKLLVDLRSKLGALETSRSKGELAPVREALESLGYAPAEIRQALEEVAVGDPVEQQIRQALKVLSKD